MPQLNDETPSAVAERSRPLHLELISALRRPALVTQWSLSTWESQVRLSRRLRLLARLAAAIDAAGLLGAVPPQPLRHLKSALQTSRWRTGSMRWAIERVGATLAGRGYPLVLLKGAAYLSQQLPIAAGRLPSDLDILVPKEALDDAFHCLRADGWQEKELDEHDSRYYREWSHELPPMQHPAHRMELDLHHNILPPVGWPRVDADLLLQELRPTGRAEWNVLAPVDQFLHSVIHLFCDSVQRDRLRDLVDLDGMARAFGGDSAFWPQLAARARRLGLDQQLAMAAHFLSAWFETPMALAREFADARIRPVSERVLLSLFIHALRPASPDEKMGLSERAVDFALLCRYHLNRLPLSLLLPHLVHKWRVARRAQLDQGSAPEVKNSSSLDR